VIRILRVTLLCALLAPPSFAINRAWTGQAGNSWSTAASWSPAGVPSPSDALTFPSTITSHTINIDVPAGTSVGPMTFDDSFTMTGNQLTLTGNVTINKSVTWSADVKFGAPLTLFTNSGTLTFNGAVDASASTVTAYRVQFNGTITGSGTIVVQMPLSISATGSFNGSIAGAGFGSAINPYYGNLPDAHVTVDNFVWAGNSTTVGDLTTATLTSNGVLTTLHTKSLRLNAGGTFDAWARDGLQSLVQANGTVTLSGGMFRLVNTPSLEVGQSLTLIDNDGTDPVSGTFANMPEGFGFYQSYISLQISYHGGDGNDVTLTRVQDKFTFTTLTQSSSQSNFHDPVTITANVYWQNDPSVKPSTGQVAFYFDNIETVPFYAPVVNGVATYTTSTLQPGGHPVSATYFGIFGYSWSYSPSYRLNHTVLGALSSAAISSPASSALYGQAVPFIVKVDPLIPGDGLPTGMVNVLADNVAVGGGTLKNGTATASNSTPIHAGTRSITAQYIGDARFRGTTSSPISITIGKMTTTIDAKPQTPVVAGAPVTMKITIAPTSGNGEIAAGALTVKEGTSTLASLDATSGSLELTLPPMLLGPHTLQVAYAGTADFEPSSATVTVNAGNAPKISVHGAEVREGNSGLTTVAVAVTLSEALADAVRVSFHTIGGSATEGVDYQAASGVVTFAPGETAKTIELHVIGDTYTEDAESFSVALTDPSNAAIDVASAVVVIANDDGAARRRPVGH
jgi:hypothetical protein